MRAEYMIMQSIFSEATRRAGGAKGPETSGARRFTKDVLG